MYVYTLPSTLNVHYISSFFGLANIAIGLDVGGGNGNSHCLNASLFSINPSIFTTISMILSYSSFSNL